MLKREMIILMETTFEADFTWRISAALRPIQEQFITVQNQLDFISSGTDNHISALEEEVEHLKKEQVDSASLLAAYAECL